MATTLLYNSKDGRFSIDRTSLCERRNADIHTRTDLKHRRAAVGRCLASITCAYDRQRATVKRERSHGTFFLSPNLTTLICCYTSPSLNEGEYRYGGIIVSACDRQQLSKFTLPCMYCQRHCGNIVLRKKRRNYMRSPGSESQKTIGPILRDDYFKAESRT